MRNRKWMIVAAAALIAIMAAACGSKGKSQESSLVETIPVDERVSQESSESAATEAKTEEASTGDTIPEGMYASELTGLPVSEDIKDQRPIAVMIDNDKRALPHYGLSEADIVYELMNSTANNRITRLMAMYKDWGKIEKVGSIRSVRPTNILLAQEWDAVICHDGGPFYINDYLSRYGIHFSGTFSRVNNGKPREFTEFILSGDLDKNFKNSSYSTTYDDREQSGDHFHFTQYGTEVDLDGQDNVIAANNVKLPFANTTPELKYNQDTKTYDYYEFGDLSKDGGDGNTVSFKNLFVLSCDFHQYDDNGYLIYNVIKEGGQGFYVTNGKAVPISYSKTSEGGITQYFGADGNPIEINNGKTYITYVPDDSWSKLTIN